MAGSSLLALLDDISTLLDDVALMSKIAVKKTTGVVGDDLALNAEQVSGFKADRELVVVWAVAKGSFVNKLILVPSALLISAFVPALVVPLLMVGGAFLCYEGFEKVAHKLLHPEDRARRTERVAAIANVEVDLVALERNKIRGAIRTDFILSAEIVVIALGTMAAAPMLQQVIALSLVGVGITVLVYGLVAGIVKIDDVGYGLHATPDTATAAATRRALGAAILRAAPYLMKTLTIAGTAAMFFVGGSIIAHGVAPLEHLGAALAAGGAQLAPVMGTVAKVLYDLLVGVLVGSILVGAKELWIRLRRGATAAP